MTDNPFTDTADKAVQATDDRQGRNRTWWETKPMTYAEWAAADRLPSEAEDFRRMEDYVDRTGPWLKDWFDRIDIAGARCLDLGSGSGIFSTKLSRRGADVTAMDLTDMGVAITGKTTAFFGQAVSVVRGDAEAAPFRDASFDFIYSWGVLHHTSDMDRALGETARILKPGGRGMMMVYHKASVVYYLHGLFWLVFRGKVFAGDTLKTVQRFYTDGFYHRYLTGAELRRKLNDVGLEVSSTTVTQYEKKILPGIPSWLDEILKARFGMCLVVQFKKPANGCRVS